MRARELPMAPFLVLGGLAAGHAALLHLMAERQVAAKLLSAGADVGVGELVAALALIVTRLALYGLGPGLALYGVGRAALTLLRRRRAASKSAKSSGAHPA